MVGEFAKRMAEEGWKIASRSDLRPTMSATGGGLQPGSTGGRRNYSTGPGDLTSKSQGYHIKVSVKFKAKSKIEDGYHSNLFASDEN